MLSKPCRSIFEFGGARYAPYDKMFGKSGLIFKTLVQTSPNVPVFGNLINAAAFGVLQTAIILLLVALFGTEATKIFLSRLLIWAGESMKPN